MARLEKSLNFALVLLSLFSSKIQADIMCWNGSCQTEQCPTPGVTGLRQEKAAGVCALMVMSPTQRLYGTSDYPTCEVMCKAHVQGTDPCAGIATLHCCDEDYCFNPYEEMAVDPATHCVNILRHSGNLEFEGAVASCEAPPLYIPSSDPEEVPVCPQFEKRGHIDVTSCESIKVGDPSVASCSNMFDGSLDRNAKGGSCFVGQSNKRGWVEVMLKQVTKVGRVVLLSKGNGEYLEGAEVDICMNNSDNCQYLGAVGEFDKDFCTVVNGYPKTGNMVRVSITGSPLVICEMKIYPN